MIAKMHSCERPDHFVKRSSGFTNANKTITKTITFGIKNGPSFTCFTISFPFPFPRSCEFWVLQFWGFSSFPSKMVKTNQRRKQDKTRSTQKKMLEPEVQQLHNVGPTVARWRVPDVIFFLYLSIVFCLGFPILPYALSFYWHFVLRPLHFI